MPMVKKSVSITDQQEEWIQVQMQSGHYATDSELVREALREKQMRMDELEAIRAKLIIVNHDFINTFLEILVNYFNHFSCNIRNAYYGIASCR